ncbi:hypothetical protein L9F63_012989, partial [Diploptera punctata]
PAASVTQCHHRQQFSRLSIFSFAEAEMRNQLLKKQKELLELQQKKLELELLQTKARLEEQQKQLDRQLRTESAPLGSTNAVTVPEATGTTTAVGIPAKGVTSTVSAASRPVPKPAVTATASSVRSRDPRLASRQTQPIVTPVVNNNSADSPPPKVGDTKEESIVNKDKEKENHKKKSSPTTSRSSSSSSSSSPSSERKKMAKTDTDSLSVGGNSNNNPTSAFKDVKASTKSRNYVRRNRPSKSRSPEIPPVTTTGDVDLRVGGPPEKHPRLTVFQSEIKVPTSSSAEEEIKIANKDIDLRQLPGSPGKKRASMERAEQPPTKKSKAEVFDELFGNEDVDLRQLTPAVAVVTQTEIPPSPPPPPIISQPSPVPTSTSSQDSSLITLSSPKRSSPDREKEDIDSQRQEDINVDNIMIHADEQLKNGTISFPQYNTLLKQVIQLNELQKLREAQRRDQQENKENWERSGDSSIDGRFGDIDERFPAAHKPRNPVPTSVPSPPEQSRPGSGKFQSGQPGRWRTPQFQPRPPFESEVESGRMDNRFRIAAPSLPPEQPQRPNSDELPPADPMLLDLIAQDTMKTINIDNVPREIRFYGDIAVAILAGYDPREIRFQGGSRRVSFDDRDSILLNLNDTYRDCIIDGNPHRIRLGAPTRELYIDGRWYECLFGGPPVNIEIGGKMHTVKLEGPPPQVKIDVVKRTDLVAGKINLIINAKIMVPVFLDAKPQRFDIEGKPHVLRFVEALNTVLINGQPIKVEFGGLPMPIVVRGKKHFIRFTGLPRGVKPGYINIVNMEDEDSNEASGKFQQGHNPVLPVLAIQKLVATGIVPQAQKTDAEIKKEEEIRSIKHVDLKQPDSLKVRQPGVLAILYSGIQCSSCGVRFPPEQTMKYSQHLDWHFRQNRRERDNAHKFPSRKWFYDVSDWIQFEEIEDLEERAQSWFETQATGEEEKEVQEVPSFYNEEREEWHLRCAIRVDGKTYHPLCYGDYKASMEASIEESSIVEPKEDEEVKKENGDQEEQMSEDVKTEEKEDAPLEAKTESMDTSEPPEVKEEKEVAEETKTEDLKVEKIEAELKDVKLEPATDDNSTQISKTETSDQQVNTVNNEPEVKVKEENIVDDDVMEPISTAVDTTLATVVSSIDGNVQFEESSQITSTGPIPGKIKINIMKPLAPSSKDVQNDDTEAETTADEQSADNESSRVQLEVRDSSEDRIEEEEVNSGEPPPPGVEPVRLKPRLVGRKLTELPPVMKGTELSGLCTIM